MENKIQKLLQKNWLQPATEVPIFTDFIDRAKQLFAPFFSAEYIAANFEIPADYRWFLEQNFNDKDFYFYNQAGVMQATPMHFAPYAERFLERRAAETPFASDKMFLSTGEKGDTHIFMVCCDKSSAYFGCYFDVYDSHPWFDADFADAGFDYDNFDAFLTELLNDLEDTTYPSEIFKNF